jgi:hypothetical protein
VGGAAANPSGPWQGRARNPDSRRGGRQGIAGIVDGARSGRGRARRKFAQ